MKIKVPQLPASEAPNGEGKVIAALAHELVRDYVGCFTDVLFQMASFGLSASPEELRFRDQLIAMLDACRDDAIRRMDAATAQLSVEGAIMAFRRDSHGEDSPKVHRKRALLEALRQDVLEAADDA